MTTLSNMNCPLQVICTEKDAMKGQLARKEKEFHDRERKLQGNLRLMQHQAKEKEALLNEQVQALKDSIKQLAEVRFLKNLRLENICCHT